MNYQDVIDNIRDLGFSDDDEMEEFGDLVPNSINRAITMISLNTDPIIEKYEFEITGVDTGFMYIDMTEVDDMFMDFADVPVMYSEQTAYRDGDEIKTKETPYYTPFNNYFIESNNTIVIDADSFNRSIPDPEKNPNEYELAQNHTYSFRICYIADHDPFTGEEKQLRLDLPLPRKAHHLVPLLAAYYVWMEDEPTKAAQYYNLYEQENEKMKAKDSSKNLRVRVLSGGM